LQAQKVNIAQFLIKFCLAKRLSTLFVLELSVGLRPIRESLLAIDLFSGVGGLGYGFRTSGFRLVGFEVNRKKVLTYMLNVGQAVEADVRFVNFERFRGSAEVIIAGPPCRPYSCATPKHRRGRVHPEYGLDLEVVRAVEQVGPRVVVVEEVPSWNPKRLSKSLRELGYRVSSRLIAFSDYGVPTLRKRLILLGIQDLDPEGVFGALEGEKEEPANPAEVLHGLPEKPNGFPDHRTYEVRSQIRELFKYIPPGYSFRSAYRAGLIPKQLVRRLIKHPEVKHGYWLYRVPLRGLVKVVPHPRRSMVLHPIHDRMLTVRELARLMTYPDSFSFKPLNVDEAMRAIGESVPPRFSEKLAKSLFKLL